MTQHLADGTRGGFREISTLALRASRRGQNSIVDTLRPRSKACHATGVTECHRAILFRPASIGRGCGGIGGRDIASGWR